MSFTFAHCELMSLKSKKATPLSTLQASPEICSFAEEDVIDEAIKYFRANVLFRKYDVKGAITIYYYWLLLHLSDFDNFF